jgi:tripartite-type tricarboxylate transporter receptor subunit TctC
MKGNMKIPHRRKFLHLAVGAAMAPVLSQSGWAQAYPSRPVRIIVGIAPGGANDLLARLIGQWLSERLGQPFVIENRPGAGGNLGAEAAVRSAPDGHTLLMIAMNVAINATLHDKLSFNFIRDTAPVASIANQPNIVVVNPLVPAKTLPEFIAYAKAHPGKLNMASAGNGTGPHMSGEMFKMMAGVDMVHVPYRGAAPAITDLIAGRMQVMFLGPALTLEHIRAGRLRALAVTTTARWEELPHLPTVGEFVPGYESTTWFGIVAPRNTPTEIVDKLNKEVNAGLADATIQSRLADLGGGRFVSSAAEFGKFIADETEKWAKVIRRANIKLR